MAWTVNTGHRPVPPDTIVNVRWRHDKRRYVAREARVPAGWLDWRHDPKQSDTDIIGWRLAE